MRARSRLTLTAATVGAAAMMAVGAAGALAATPAPWNQGFEADTTGWFDADDSYWGDITRVASGTGRIASSKGDSHAQVNGDGVSAPFSRFGGYAEEFPSSGSWVAEVDVHLDPAWSSGTGFDYSVAANGSDGDHQRDFIFHVTKDTSTGKLLVGGSNNTNFAPREDLENINHYEVERASWYTLRHTFRNEAGQLAVDLQLVDGDGVVQFTETRTNAADTIPAEVGGNRYAWFTFVNVPDLPIDEHQLLAIPSEKNACKKGGWAAAIRADGSDFKNQGACIRYVNTGR